MGKELAFSATRAGPRSVIASPVSPILEPLPPPLRGLMTLYFETPAKLRRLAVAEPGRNLFDARAGSQQPLRSIVDLTSEPFSHRRMAAFAKETAQCSRADIAKVCELADPEASLGRQFAPVADAG